LSSPALGGVVVASFPPSSEEEADNPVKVGRTPSGRGVVVARVGIVVVVLLAAAALLRSAADLILLCNLSCSPSSEDEEDDDGRPNLF
jgi:hypothetical protein